MTKLYLRPVGFIDSPQRHDGESLRLAGTMLWFSQIEVIDCSTPVTTRKLVAVGAWEDYVTTLKAGTAERCRKLHARLASPRAPLQLGQRIIRLDQPQVMGIVNMTPDSFLDGGSNANNEDAVDAAFAMTKAGAAIIDVGGESTRPGASLVWEGDEVARVEPLIKRLAGSGTAISIDTRKALVMETAIAAGAGMINDISALLFDERALAVAKATGAPVVLMHAPSQGSDPHKGGEYADVVIDVFDWLEARVDAIEAAGISRDKILVDPGIGFGKSLADNLSIINSLSIYHGLGCAILFGASRKRMIGALANEAPPEARLGGSILLAIKAIEQAAHILRVHDVAETVQAVQIWRGLRDAALTARA